MANYQHDPFLNYNANLLKQAGTEQYTTGRLTQQRGQEISDKGVADLQPVYDYFRKLLSGDTTEMMSAIQPEADVISQQFDQVRRMLSDQPRGGGKTSVSASLPIEHIRMLSNLLSSARSRGAEGAGSVASKMIGAGENRSYLGLNQVGQGTGAAGNAASIALGGRAQDFTKKTWKDYFTELAQGGITRGIAAVGGMI